MQLFVLSPTSNQLSYDLADYAHLYDYMVNELNYIPASEDEYRSARYHQGYDQAVQSIMSKLLDDFVPVWAEGLYSDLLLDDCWTPNEVREFHQKHFDTIDLLTINAGMDGDALYELITNDPDWITILDEITSHIEFIEKVVEAGVNVDSIVFHARMRDLDGFEECYRGGEHLQDLFA